MRRVFAVTFCLVVFAASVFADTARFAQQHLTEIFQDRQSRNEALAALEAVQGQEAQPLFVTLSKKGDKNVRMFSTAALGKFNNAEANSALTERFANDSEMPIRAEALVHLLHNKAIDAHQLADALNIPDEKIKCIAARGLLDLNRGFESLAVETLKKLADSDDPSTAGLSVARLLMAGHSEYKDRLMSIADDPNSAAATIALILGYIEEKEIAAACEFASKIAGSPDRSLPMRILAYSALAKSSSDAPAEIVAAINESHNIVFNVQLLAALSKHPNATKYIEKLSIRQDSIGMLANFELARPAGGKAATRAVARAIASGHPIVIEYVMDRAKKDIERLGKNANFYTPPFLNFIESTNPNAAAMGPEHMRASRASGLLMDTGSASAFAGLAELLSKRYSATVRCVAAGLMRTKNREAAGLAVPLLKSPYEELATDAALMLGRLGDGRAAQQLAYILKRSDNYSVTIRTLACWYLLKIHGQAEPTATLLAQEIK